MIHSRYNMLSKHYSDSYSSQAPAPAPTHTHPTLTITLTLSHVRSIKFHSQSQTKVVQY